MKKKILLAILLFIIGTFKVNALLEIPPNSYVIGKHLFTRDGSNNYGGVLTTEDLTFASMTSKGVPNGTTVIYKRADGSFIDGLTGEEKLVNEEHLIANINYYNMYTIPVIKSFYSKTTTSYIFQSDKINLWKWTPLLDAGVEYYSFSDGKNAKVFGTQEFYYPDEVGFESMSLNLLEQEATGMWDVQGIEVTFNPDISNYTVIGYPYINVVDKVGNSKKIYLKLEVLEGAPPVSPVYGNSTLYSSVASVRNDLTLNASFENDKLKINVTDENTQKYKLIEASLYRYFEDWMHNDHFSIKDFLLLYQKHNPVSPSLDQLDYMATRMQYNNGECIELVDKYEDFSEVPVYDNLLDEIELSDLGNTEAVAGGKYLVYAQVIDEDGNTFRVASDLLDAGDNLISSPTNPSTNDLFLKIIRTE
ncbi:MAG: hypothetical protein GX951_04120 [Mollicutes bacterium]|nr:hypothetical protein [Mollicutes bacterium]